MFKHITEKGHLKKFKDKVIERLYGYKDREENTSYQSESEEEFVDDQEKLKVVKERETDSSQVTSDFKANSEASDKPVQQKYVDANISNDAEDDGFSLQQESDKSDSEEAIPVKRRRRHGKHKSTADSEVQTRRTPSLTNNEDKGPVSKTGSGNDDSCLKLSKNQRRKLKKKRRDKEKKLQTTETGVEFTFKVTKGLKTKNIDEKRITVVDFLDAVWDVYSAQNSRLPSLSNEEQLMNRIQCRLNDKESYDAEEIELLHSVISILVLNDRERSRTKIEEFSKETNMNNATQILVTRLFQYWATEVMTS